MAAPAIVQSGTNYGTTNNVVTLGTNITVGNFLVALGFVSEGLTSFSSGDLSDNLSNVWTEHVDYASANNRLVGIWTAPITSGGSCSINLIDKNGYQGICVIELSGCNNADAIDQVGYYYDPYTAAISVDLANTTYAEDIIFGICGTADYFGTLAAGSGWTELSNNNSGRPQMTVIYRTTASTGNYDPSFTHDGDPLLAAGIAIKGTSDSATALPRRALDGPIYGSLRGSVR